jgi:hypothetical protein
MTLGRNRKRALSTARKDFELLPATSRSSDSLWATCTQELREVLIHYRRLELEMERDCPGLIFACCNNGAEITVERRFDYRSTSLNTA